VAERCYFIRGEIDLATAPALEADLGRVTADNADSLVVDCADLTFIDSAGAAVLRATMFALASQDRGFRVINTDGVTEHIFEVHGVVARSRDSGAPNQSRLGGPSASTSQR
jgi:anti-anti-sigma factor